jgi:group I intron endonuclease
MIGIYMIENIRDNKKYIGKSLDISRRWGEHMEQGRYATSVEDEFHYELYEHPHRFRFQILEECKEDELNEREAYYINLYNSIEKGYNKINASIDSYQEKEDKEPTKKEIIQLITRLLEKPLLKEDKEKISKFFNLKGTSGKQLKWPSVKRLIISQGFDVIETRRKVNGVQVNCSVIRLRWED